MENEPLVSIGMPVFNEERFIERSLNSLASQNYKNIELLISDNASSDSTYEICNKFAEQYDWIKCHRFNENVGAAENFKYVLEEAHGKYFMWASGHDLWSINLISESVKLLESHQDAAVVTSVCEWIDEEDSPFARESGFSDTRGMNIVGRYFTVMWGNMHPILGLLNRSYLIDNAPKNVVGSDLILLSILSLKGDFLCSPNTSWSRREFRVEQSYTDKLERYKSNDYGLAIGKLNKLFPLLFLPIELIKGVLVASISWKVKLCILFLLLPTLPVKYLSGTRKI
jgi:glycosyltransferase involved in cell wall biosynthesis